MWDMKKIILISIGLMVYALGYSFVNYGGPNMWDGPEVEEERAQGAAYVPPDREFINSRYGEYIDNREVEFSPGDDANRLFWSYSQP
ncbi:hypothetical protein FTF1137c [Francisella tularensis subsp. tularensis FSC198]|uniref:Uncharacterized protein n=7 Tax=Francisella TaxID=262 RepID=Q5NFT4_FRATT|nr:conserved hypothetical protein [Francisella tularensis subsp. mediasiatica FSC147]ADA78822.1 hypothetical protein NE061598_06555 [Francisella tularensis subsp. tularensis NE061598]APA83284.1 hypothetical protein N894_1300 [Francisella tularensis subsp. novicida PA10-7858]AVC44097.1 hypothetical protein B4919_04545 [Francisella tularensis subsp. novicida]EDN34597.1 conserved hypothetical protein [Francisella tularensis subsp. tularensis FSC033]EDX19527.1 hypothetical protein FTE_0516 [Franci